jgi:hypothetical protein
VLIAGSFFIAVATAPYPFSRYYTLRTEARDQGRGYEWWIGRPLGKVAVDLPKLFVTTPSEPADIRDRNYLMSFPNGVNLLMPDFWILKASMLGIPAALLGVAATGLLGLFCWGIWKAFRPFALPG